MRAALALAFLSLAFSGCLSGTPGQGAPSPAPATDPLPDFPLPDQATGLKLVNDTRSGGAQGVWVQDGYAYLSGGQGLRIYDVRDPVHPRLLSDTVEGTEGTRDVDLMRHPNGHLYAVLAHGGPAITFADVTDPANATHVTDVTPLGNAHNIAVVPNSTLVYNSRSISEGNVGAGQVDIVDFADPQAPVVTLFTFPSVAVTVGGLPKPVTATTCHDITFEPRKRWALCAGISETQVWDIQDPLHPAILQVVESPLTNIHHGAWAVQNGTLLVIGDEVTGAIVPLPNCLGGSNPYAQLWFWDVSDLAKPTPLGYFEPRMQPLEGGLSLCTTHFGSPVADRHLFAIGWYGGGTFLVDYTDPRAPTEVARYAPAGTDVWDARYWNGHVFTGDTQLGMQVLRIV